MVSQLLKGKRGIIFGALDENSIAWRTALKVHAQGGTFTLTNAPIALRLGKINELAEQCNKAEIIPADATSEKDLQTLFTQSLDLLGGKLDFVLHSIGMSPNVRKDRHYGEMDHAYFLKTLDISGLSFYKIMQIAEKTDAMNDWGSIVALSYIAAQRTFPGYADMAQAKAVLESIARSYGYRFAKLKKVRVNTISQSPTKTIAGRGIGDFDAFFEYAQMMSPLGNAPADGCADYIVTLFSDLTRYVTMQNLMHDGGFSTTGITEDVMNRMFK